jgi:hypothetical protein
MSECNYHGWPFAMKGKPLTDRKMGTPLPNRGLPPAGRAAGPV